MTTTPFAGTPPHRTNKPWTKAVKGGATTPLTAARPPSQPDHPFATHNPFTTLQPTHDDSTDDGSGQSANILLMPADGDIVVTVAVLDDIVANLDGARNIATIGTIAAQTNGVGAAAPDGTLDGAFGERTNSATRFGGRNEIRYNEREATDDPTNGNIHLGGRTTSEIRFGGRNPIERPTVEIVDAAASDGVFLDPATGGKHTTLPTPRAPGHSPATLTDAGDNHTLANADADILFRAIRVSLPKVAAVLV